MMVLFVILGMLACVALALWLLIRWADPTRGMPPVDREEDDHDPWGKSL